MSKIQHFEDLDVWQKSASLYNHIALMCEHGKFKHDYTAKDQLKRAALSISNNIAEGYEYENNLQFIRFLRYAKGSAGEVRSMLNVFYQSDFIEEKTYRKLLDDVTFISQILKNFIKYLQSNSRKSTTTP